MNRSSPAALIGTALFLAAAIAILLTRFDDLLPPVPLAVPVMLGALAVTCGYAAVKVRARKRDGRIGQDRSQLNPVTAAQLLVLGKASAWTGAITGGVYGGLVIHLAGGLGRLISAAEELPAAVAALVAALALAVAGVVLERSCEVSPPTEGETVG